jgi:hypothetical protein
VRREKEASVDMEFHDTSSCAVNEEVLIVDIKNGSDVCTVSKVTDRNIKLVPYDTAKKILKKLWMIRYSMKLQDM